MKKYTICFSLLLVLLLSACNDDFLEEKGQRSSEKAVTVLADFGTWNGAETRAINIPQKTSFEEGEVIHVQGDFTLKDGGTERRYDTYKYTNGKWVANSSEGEEYRLTWPWNATKGTFTAYFVGGTNDTALSADGGSLDGVLGGDYNLNDPLKAVAEVEYGYAVNLHFEHLCTRLIILNTKNNYAEEYWFGRKNPVVNNAYKLNYAPDSPEGLSVSFHSNTELNEGAISTIKVMPGADAGTEDNSGYVVLYLQPGKYRGSELNYADNRPYLTLNVDALDKPSDAEPNGLQAGHSYILDINKASGIVDQEQTKDPWDTGDPETTDFDIQTFLDAIVRGEEYPGILEYNAAGHLALLKNLNFAGKEYIPKNIPANITFDGDYHYIKNAIHSIFFNIEGNARNLEIRNTTITKYANETAYRSGALARTSRGKIDNIRIRDLSITLPGLAGSERKMFVGGLIGELNGGEISNIQIIGKHELTINDPKGDVNGQVFLGGIVGQAASQVQGAVIKNVTMHQDENGNAPEITITLNSQGQSTASVGGVAGVTAISLENCTFSATIDCSLSKVLGCGVGGLFGREISQENAASYTISNCNVSGTIYGPFCHSVVETGGTSYGRSSIGGIGGGVQGRNVLITHCNSFCELFDYFSYGDTSHANEVVSEDVYATGSAFGRFTSGNASNQTKNCRAWGKVNAKNATQIGNGKTFIGKFIGYTKSEFTLDPSNITNNTANGGLDDYGGVFEGND